MKKRSVLAATAGAVIVLGIVAVFAALQVDGIAWRAAVVARMAQGKIDELTWGELVTMLQPGSGYYLEPLRRLSNPYAVIRNPHATAQDQEAGAQIFAVYCSACHGANGEGVNAPSLLSAALKTGDADWSLFRVITRGAPEIAMPPVGLPEKDAWQVVAHVRKLRLAAAAATAATLAADSRIPQSFGVPPERIANAAQEPHNWLTYSGSYNSRRHSALTQIDTGNVADLKLAWSLQLRTDQAVEASPLVVDGLMFLSEPPSNVLAVDAASGERLWTYNRPVPSALPVCCGRVNRGVALLGERVFIGTLDGFLVALDARTGRVAWETKVADYADGFTITTAPLALRDLIVIGVAGGEFGIRGFLDAYDAATGELRWRFQTIPEPGQPGSETWSGDAWQDGGGPTWLTGSYDPDLDLVYWGVGNPSPDFNGDVRPGDNLFTNSVVALAAGTGELAWHFQFTPHDEHDWDANQIPVLVDREIDGRARRLMLWANRNAFYYVLDRTNGEFLGAREFVRQNWAERIDENGRPVLTANASPSVRGTLTMPGAAGGTNWWSPSYSPVTDLFYVPFVDAPKVFFKEAPEEHEQGERTVGGASVFTGEPFPVGVRALHPLTGERVWEHSIPPRNTAAMTGGILTTAGNVLFSGDQGIFYALDARTGQPLWRVNLGGNVRAAPISFAVGGRQHVAIAAGDTFFAFRL